MAWLFIGAYVLTTLWFTCGSMIGNAEPGLVAYLFTWDMFPYHYTESVRRVAVGRSTSGRIVRLVPSKLEQYRGGVHDDLTRADLERRGVYFRPLAERMVRLQEGSGDAAPVVEVRLYEQYWPAKFNWSPERYAALFGRARPERRYWRLRERVTVARGPSEQGAAP